MIVDNITVYQYGNRSSSGPQILLHKSNQLVTHIEIVLDGQILKINNGADFFAIKEILGELRDIDAWGDVI